MASRTRAIMCSISALWQLTISKCAWPTTSGACAYDYMTGTRTVRRRSDARLGDVSTGICLCYRHCVIVPRAHWQRAAFGQRYWIPISLPRTEWQPTAAPKEQYSPTVRFASLRPSCQRARRPTCSFLPKHQWQGLCRAMQAELNTTAFLHQRSAEISRK